MSARSYDYLVKIILIGDSGVEKNKILAKFVNADFPDMTSQATIGVDFSSKTIEIDGKEITLQIWDTAGQERFHCIATAYYRGAMGVMLVYDIRQETTFESIPKYLLGIKEHAREDVELMILGNNCDKEDERAVSKERGEALAQELGMKFFETSVKDNTNIEEAFFELAQDIYNKHLKNKDQSDNQNIVKLTEETERHGNRRSGCCN